MESRQEFVGAFFGPGKGFAMRQKPNRARGLAGARAVTLTARQVVAQLLLLQTVRASLLQQGLASEVLREWNRVNLDALVECIDALLDAVPALAGEQAKGGGGDE